MSSKNVKLRSQIRRVGDVVKSGDRTGRIIAVSGDDVGVQWDDGPAESVKAHQVQLAPAPKARR